MNTSLISHRMFVAALTNDGHVSDKPSPSTRRVEGIDPARTSLAKPPTKALTVLATRPWMKWPFNSWEERSAS